MKNDGSPCSMSRSTRSTVCEAVIRASSSPQNTRRAKYRPVPGSPVRSIGCSSQYLAEASGPRQGLLMGSTEVCHADPSNPSPLVTKSPPLAPPRPALCDFSPRTTWSAVPDIHTAEARRGGLVAVRTRSFGGRSAHGVLERVGDRAWREIA